MSLGATTRTYDDVEGVALQETSSLSDVRSGKPPVVPYKAASNAKPKSIIKRSSSASSSRRCVSFADADDNFSEPSIQFWMPRRLPGNAAATTRSKEEHTVPPAESTSSGQIDGLEQHTKPNVEETAKKPQQPADSLSDSPFGSPALAFNHRFEHTTKKIEEEASGALAPNANNKEASPRVVFPEAVHGAEDASFLANVSVSDKTPSPSSLSVSLQQVLSVSSKKAVINSESPVNNQQGIAPAQFKESGRQQAAAGASSSPPFFEGQTPVIQTGEGVPSVQPPPLTSSMWFGDDAGAPVQPVQTQSAAVTHLCENYRFPFHHEGSDVLPLEKSGSDPSDLVFNKSSSTGLSAAIGIEKKDIGNNNNCTAADTRLCHGRRVIDFPVQLYPVLLTTEELSRSKNLAIFQHLPPQNAAENEQTRWFLKSSGQKCQLCAGNSNHSPSPPQLILCKAGVKKMTGNLPAQQSPLQADKLNGSSSEKNLQAAADFGVRVESPEARMSESQCPQRGKAGCKAFLPLTYVHPQARARPVTVNYVNNMSAFWQENLRPVDHRQSHSAREAMPPLNQRDVSKELFPEAYFGQSQEAIEKNCAIYPAVDTPNAQEVASIKQTKTLTSKSVGCAKKKRNKHLGPTVVPVEVATSVPKSCSAGKGHTTQLTETPDVTPVQNETLTGSSMFEELGLFNAHLTQEAGFASSKAVDVSTEHQRRIQQDTGCGKTANSSNKVESGCSGNSPGSTKAQQKAESADEERRRLKRFEKLRSVLLQIAYRNEFSSQEDTNATDCGSRFLQERYNGREAAAAVEEMAGRRRRRRTLPPPPSPVTAEGLIHTPERAVSPGESEETLYTQPFSFSASRRCSPPGVSSHFGQRRSSHRVLYRDTGAMLERRVSDHNAVKNFAHDIAGIVRSLRESTLVKIL